MPRSPTASLNSRTMPPRCAHAAEATAERAAVLIAGPLGLCFCQRLSVWASFRWWWPGQRRPAIGLL
ncbi:hypothetical protein I553_5876 [Mycobacterium xenopi 4042]|uniref:Uncharacterized protein n=1 Tax=Mycobacterium xenopi 4042 TaxID=1299334 RepID=X7ZXD5_MYCXE|nr:hypothetical protein I553_5876 [Mycobacterium xenopi 4042]